MFLRLLLAEILEVEVQLARGVFLYPPRYRNAAWLGQGFEPSSDVDAVAEDIAVLHDDVALMDAHAELDAPFEWNIGVAHGHLLLHFSGVAQRVDDALEFEEDAVTGGLDDTASMFGYFGVDQLTAHGPKLRQGSGLSRPMSRL